MRLPEIYQLYDQRRMTMAYKYAYNEEEVKYQPPKLKTNRQMWKLTVLSVLTLGIYSIMFFIPLSFDLDKVDPKRERGKTMNYLFAYVLAMFSFGIVIDIWHYHIARRIEEALERRKIEYEFGTIDFWKWFLLGSLIFVGPFVYFHKLCKAMNLLCESYNENPVLD